MSSLAWLTAFLGGPAVIGIGVALLRARHAKRSPSFLRDLLSVALSALFAMLIAVLFGLGLVLAGDYGSVWAIIGVLVIPCPIAAFAAAVTHMTVLARRDSGRYADDFVDSRKGSG